mmetsp:Transcript_4828/g.7320  ORF Transcript_4828/g.7320 Transcript_4828/m.7320 type:complete len:352 (+) Transcript_4828:60-1115(+)
MKSFAIFSTFAVLGLASACPTGSIPDASGVKCCAASCGTCGGYGCDKRPGGSSACCTGSVTTSCTLGYLPCVINGTPTTTPTTAPSSNCPPGSIADSSGTRCCPSACGLCGGLGCDKRPGGDIACCTGSITLSCTLGVLPCVINGTPTPTTAPTNSPSSCPSGSIADASGVKCCAASCGLCGGYGCDSRPGGAAACCTGSVTKSCTLGSLPCVVNGAPTTAPTTAPSSCPPGSITDATGTKCCAATCGICGGYGCDARPGGDVACCTGSVTKSCTLGGLPCVINGTPTTTTPPVQSCPTGSVADASGTKCCPANCGLCGGSGCDTRPGGAYNCCTSSITKYCVENVLPCML